MLEKTIKAKNPNSIPMMIKAATEIQTPQGIDPAEHKKACDNVKKLEYELQMAEENFDKKLRTMRQEQERMKGNYERRIASTPTGKEVQKLNQEMETMKTYYEKRIRELDQKLPGKKPPKGEKSPAIQSMEDEIQKLKKENAFLATKVASKELNNQKRRNSEVDLGKLVSDFHTRPVFAVVGGVAILLKESENDSEKVLDLV